MKSLGADHVIDYTKEDFTGNGTKYDVIFDTIGKIPIKKAMKSLNDKGQLLLASAGIGTMIGGSVRSMLSSKSIASGVIKETVEDMNFFKQEIEEGRLNAVIDKTYPLEQIAEAHRYVDKGHKKGNVIISIQ
jgi:NADPH:quinone reductase-like Zn-dependent oxidoreductase